MAIQTSKSDRLIAEYLRELRVSAWNQRLPESEAAVLERRVRADIDAALVAAGDRDEATVYGVLDRLGPPSASAARVTAVPRSATQRAVDTLLAPVASGREILRVQGWGLAEIGALLLLIVGPFYLWWIAPVFGITLVRAAADRWSDRAMHRATVLVAALFGIQVLVSLALLALAVMGGGSAAEALQQAMAMVAPGGASGPPLVPPVSTPGGLASLSPVQIIIASPAFLAGVLSGVYLALSPRHRA